MGQLFDIVKVVLLVSLIAFNVTQAIPRPMEWMPTNGLQASSNCDKLFHLLERSPSFKTSSNVQIIKSHIPQRNPDNSSQWWLEPIEFAKRVWHMRHLQEHHSRPPERSDVPMLDLQGNNQDQRGYRRRSVVPYHQANSYAIRCSKGHSFRPGTSGYNFPCWSSQNYVDNHEEQKQFEYNSLLSGKNDAISNIKAKLREFDDQQMSIKSQRTPVLLFETPKQQKKKYQQQTWRGLS